MLSTDYQEGKKKRKQRFVYRDDNKTPKNPLCWKQDPKNANPPVLFLKGNGNDADDDDLK